MKSSDMKSVLKSDNFINSLTAEERRKRWTNPVVLQNLYNLVISVYFEQFGHPK